jgi:hypothetical protein
MGYQYQNFCLDTVDDLYQRFALDCTGKIISSTGSTSVGYIAKCSPVATGVNVRLYDLSTSSAVGTTTLVQPNQITCTASSSSPITNADAVQTAWLVISVWVVAWGVRKLIDLLKR